jgi:hypothetical protein
LILGCDGEQLMSEVAHLYRKAVGVKRAWKVSLRLSRVA